MASTHQIKTVHSRNATLDQEILRPRAGHIQDHFVLHSVFVRRKGSAFCNGSYRYVGADIDTGLLSFFGGPKTQCVVIHLCVEECKSPTESVGIEFRTLP